MDLRQVLETQQRVVDSALASIAGELAEAEAGGLHAPLHYALAGGGKRLRGVLCLLAHRALGGPGGPGTHDVACALEIVHTYSLVHDDLPCMDDDDLRRGRPTLHRVFGAQTAAVTGAALIPLGFRILARGARILQLGEETGCRLAVTLAQGIGGSGMVGGQWLDLLAEGRTPPLPELLEIHRAKTGALFRAALAMGAISAGASPARVSACGDFGAALGLAFQVVDDILDETAESTVLGKTAGKDRRQHKATYPHLLGLEGARQRARNALDGGRQRLRDAGIESMELDAVGEWVLARDH